jgi:hypothetical protein
MTDADFRDTAQIEVIKTFLQKIPGVGLPGDNFNPYQREEFIRKLARDSLEMAEAMLKERNTKPIV